MKKQLEEMTLVANLLNITTLKGYRDVESINTGSLYKNKEDILTQACQVARKYRRLTSTIQSCLETLLEGGTINDFYQYKLQQATRTNQPEQDRLDSMEELELFTDLIIEI